MFLRRLPRRKAMFDPLAFDDTKVSLPFDDTRRGAPFYALGLSW